MAPTTRRSGSWSTTAARSRRGTRRPAQPSPDGVDHDPPVPLLHGDGDQAVLRPVEGGGRVEAGCRHQRAVEAIAPAVIGAADRAVLTRLPAPRPRARRRAERRASAARSTARTTAGATGSTARCCRRRGSTPPAGFDKSRARPRPRRRRGMARLGDGQRVAATRRRSTMFLAGLEIDVADYEPERLVVGATHALRAGDELEADRRELPRVLPLPEHPSASCAASARRRAARTTAATPGSGSAAGRISCPMP